MICTSAVAVVRRRPFPCAARPLPLLLSRRVASRLGALLPALLWVEGRAAPGQHVSDAQAAPARRPSASARPAPQRGASVVQASPPWVREQPRSGSGAVHMMSATPHSVAPKLTCGPCGRCRGRPGMRLQPDRWATGTWPDQAPKRQVEVLKQAALAKVQAVLAPVAMVPCQGASGLVGGQLVDVPGVGRMPLPDPRASPKARPASSGVAWRSRLAPAPSAATLPVLSGRMPKPKSAAPPRPEAGGAPKAVPKPLVPPPPKADSDARAASSERRSGERAEAQAATGRRARAPRAAHEQPPRAAREWPTGVASSP